MSNSPARKGPPLGPAPSAAVEPALTRSHRRVLAALRTAGAPASLTALAATTSLHVNTLREHLAALEAGGFVARSRANPAGRGRPAWLYEPVDAAPMERATPYAALASALADVIHRTSPAPEADAVDAGTAWGRNLAHAGRGAAPEGVGAGREGSGSARRQVVRILDDLGFAPEGDARATSVRLTQCPLLDAARATPDVVCGVHLGIVRGVLHECGGHEAGVELSPFSDPGFCRLRMPPPPRPSSPPA